MSNPTPYDTGARLQPMPWHTQPSNLPDDDEADRYGRVDFDNDEGATVLTAYMEPDGNGGYTLHLDADEAAVTVAFNGVALGMIPAAEPDEGEEP